MNRPKAKIYRLVSKNSNSWKSGSPHSGCYETETAQTIDTKGGDATCNQGGNLIVYPDKARSLIARADSSPCVDRGQNIAAVYENHQQDNRITECGEVAPTVAAKYGTGGNNTPLVKYSLDRASCNQGQNAQFDISIQEEQVQTLAATGPHAVAQLSEHSRCVVRRMTPLECSRLQGYPDYWAQDLTTPDPTDEEIDRWSGVWNEYAQINGIKPKTRNQIAKWLKSPHSDSAEYKMWGNSLAIPCAYNVLAGIAEELREERSKGLNAKEPKAIDRIAEAYAIAERMGKTLIVAYSGGKDSDVLLDLAIKSGASFEVEHNHTTADAPQTVYHIREVFKRLNAQGIAARVNPPPEMKNVDGKTIRASMWSLIPKKQMPPTRLARYCCQYFKERHFEGQHILLGVRRDESNARKRRGVHESIAPKKENSIVYLDENDDRRKLLEICQMRNRIATNPIINRTDEEIWAYIRANGIAVNPLYSQGFKRVGCIGCPLAGCARQKREFEAFPKYRQLYLRAFEKMIEARNAKRGKQTRGWQTAQEVFNWWTDPKFNPNQMTFADYEKGLGNDEDESG